VSGVKAPGLSEEGRPSRPRFVYKPIQAVVLCIRSLRASTTNSSTTTAVKAPLRSRGILVWGRERNNGFFYVRVRGV
jgi:hypothetical protein